ncbi:hypothetical protein G9A89_011759 [Geosiphon pyriformis]|nr:hypothetical protein G9A89_011759 [Geosiphon pyriformis]
MKLDAKVLRYMSAEEFRVLTAVEMGSKNHEVVPTSLVAQIAKLRNGGSHKLLGELAKRNLVARVKNAKYDGYRLAYGGYDYLALKAFVKRGSVYSVGNQIGVGKESDVYIVADEEETQRVLKIHRLGRVSFRAIKSKRDYLQKRKSASWIYMSRLAAMKEYAFMKVLHENGFPVPQPIDQARHCVVMELIDAYPLRQVAEVRDPGKLYSDLMDIIVRLAEYGLIHGDFNEFNILVKDDGEPVLIDFPQMVSISHPNAEWYFNRDVDCIRTFFRRRYGYESMLYPKFKLDVNRQFDLDVQVAASGFTKKNQEELEAYQKEVIILDNEDEKMIETNESEELSEENQDEIEEEDYGVQDDIVNPVKVDIKGALDNDEKTHLKNNLSESSFDSNEESDELHNRSYHAHRDNQPPSTRSTPAPSMISTTTTHITDAEIKQRVAHSLRNPYRASSHKKKSTMVNTKGHSTRNHTKGKEKRRAAELVSEIERFVALLQNAALSLQSATQSFQAASQSFQVSSQAFTMAVDFLKEAIAASKANQKNKKLKKDKGKDPNFPKKVPNAYIYYCNEVRPKVMEENPEWKNSLVMSKVGEMWRDLTDEDKQRYEKMHERETRKRQKAVQIYLSKRKGGSPNINEEENKEIKSEIVKEESEGSDEESETEPKESEARGESAESSEAEESGESAESSEAEESESQSKSGSSDDEETSSHIASSEKSRKKGQQPKIPKDQPKMISEKATSPNEKRRSEKGIGDSSIKLEMDPPIKERKRPNSENIEDPKRRKLTEASNNTKVASPHVKESSGNDKIKSPTHGKGNKKSKIK